MPQEKSVTAILVAYNSEGVIADALKSLAGQAEIASIIVVDNCSTDNTCELLRRDFPQVTLIENPRNDGFGRANNIALNKVRTPYALLLNPDAVVAPGALPALLAAAERYPDAAILAPALYDEEGRLHRSHKRSVFTREASGDEYVSPEGDICADFLSGAVWLLNMRLMKEIGYFDPHIFLYYEDDDLCIRARRAGYGLVLVPDASATHLMGASSGRPKPEAEFFKQRQLIWSRLHLEKKYRGEKAMRRLALKLNMEYSFKAAWYCLQFNREKLNRYRGRLAGVSEFTQKAAPVRKSSR
jgi:N-acetylglucosaminyl-diphospho-decaprenol L-rhamnosyltransferase